MNRLVTFGCSLTYGSALDDPKDSWPSQLATKWNMGLVNMGIPGASAKRIWWEIMNFDFHKSDVVVVLWTHMDRWCILQDTQRRGRSGTGDHVEWDIPGKIQFYPDYKHPTDMKLVKTAEAYYKYMHDDYDMLNQYLCYTNHANYYLKDKVKKQYHVRASEQETTLPFNNVDFLPIDFERCQGDFPLATDNQHPGKEGYAWFVEQIDSLVNKELEKLDKDTK